jgi:AcrR family transcriptional regulator
MARPADPHAKVDLLRAAEEIFVAHGLDVAKVEEITALAGRSKGAFYLHFGSKEEAFRQIVETLLARLVTKLDEPSWQLCAPGDTAAYLEHWHEKDVECFEFLWQNRGVCRLMLEGGRSAAFGYLVDEFAERARVQTQRALKWGVENQILRRDLDVELASLVLSGAYDRIARELVKLPRRPDLRRWLREVQRVLYLGTQIISDPTVMNPKRKPRRSR